MTYTLAVGTKNWSCWSLRAWLAMKASGAAFTEQFVPLRATETSAAASKASPSGLVPALTITDGGAPYAIWDSLAICETLAERHPEARLWPEAPRARAQARAISCEMHSGFVALRQQMSMDFARTIPDVVPTPETAKAITRILSIWETCRASEGGDGPYLFGHFTIADCFYAPVVSRFHTYGVATGGAAEAYASAIMSHPFMREWGRAAAQEVAEGRA